MHAANNAFSGRYKNDWTSGFRLTRGEVELKVSAPEYPFQMVAPKMNHSLGEKVLATAYSDKSKRHDPTIWWNATQEAIRQLLDGQEAKNLVGLKTWINWTNAWNG